MSKPTIKSLTEDLKFARSSYGELEKSFDNLSNGYAEGVKRIAEQREMVDVAVRQMNEAIARANELERRLKKAERAAARYADANAKAILLLDWMTANDRAGDDG